MNVYAVIILTSILTGVGSKIYENVFNADTLRAEAKNAIDIQITKVDTKVNSLCNDYSQTIYRIDQNMQNLGRALKVDVVRGKVDVNPCQ